MNSPGEALSQINLTTGTSTPSVTVQALRLFLSQKRDDLRFYVSSMLPTKTENAIQSSSGSETKPGDFLRSSLLDEQGGLVNASIGYYSRVPRVDKRAEDADHGLLVDLRTGVKLLEVPGTGQQADATGLAKAVSAFWTSSFGLSYSVGLYDLDDAGQFKKAGGLIFNLTGVVSSAADSRYTTAFTTKLQRTLANVNANVVISLPSVLYITIGGTLYSNDPEIGKRLVVSFNAMR